MKKLLLFFMLPLLLASCNSSSSSDSHSHIEPDPIEFEEVYFDSKTVSYDGNPHILDEVRGAPEGTTITYYNREEFTEVGTYNASATLTKKGYIEKTLKATLKINKASFENITFENGTFDYDGEEHSIYVSGAPSFASVSYSNNGKKSVGTYAVTATISAPNYNTLKKTAILRIIGKEITGVSFEDQIVEYDGKKHYLEVSGDLPVGVEVSYSNNGKVDAGSYTVTASLSGEGYESTQLKATLTINPAPISKPGNFYTRIYIYDGQNHSVEVTNAPSYATITYKCLNATGTNTFKNPGTYIIEATVKTDNNHISKLKANLVIVEKGVIGIDSSLEGLTIDENLTWDELYDALNSDNFTCAYYSGCYDVKEIDEPRPEGLLNEDFIEHTTHAIFGSNGKEAYSEADYSSLSEFSVYDFYKEVGDDIIHLDFSSDYNSGSFGRFPKAAFSETVAKMNSADAFVALTKGENGEFQAGIDRDDYYYDVGYPFIEDNTFTVLMEHPRTLDNGEYKFRYFYRIYKFYNIGNTLVSLPDSCSPSEDYIDGNIGFDDYYLGGVRYLYQFFGNYTNMTSYYSANLYVTYKRMIFLKPGTYTVLPYIYDQVIRAIDHTSLYYDYNKNQEGYIFNLYVDSDGVYQGEYSELGSLARFTISRFLSYGGEVHYYNEWH